MAKFGRHLTLNFLEVTLNTKMPKKDAQNATIRELVEGFLENRMDARGALSQWPNIETERNSLIKEMWHRLTHFVDDADIRKDDASYDTAERLHIRRLFEKWRAEVGRRGWV